MTFVATCSAVRPRSLLERDRWIAVTFVCRNANELDQGSHPETSH